MASKHIFFSVGSLLLRVSNNFTLMSDDKQPTEKELQDLAKKVDKLVSSKKVKQLMKNPSAAVAASGSNEAEQTEAMKAQLRQMMESMALLERAGKIKTSGKKDMGDHQFWKTQPVPRYGKFCGRECVLVP